MLGECKRHVLVERALVKVVTSCDGAVVHEGLNTLDFEV